MRNAAAFRLTSHVLMYFAIVSAPARFRAEVPLFALTAASVLFVSLIAVRFEKPFIRLAAGALPALALLYGAHSTVGLILAAVPAAYSAGFLAAGRFDLETWRYRREAAIVFCVTPFVLLVSLLAAGTYPASRLFSPCACFLAVLALRSLRAGSGPSARLQAGNALIPIAAVAGLMALGYAVWLIAPAFGFVAKALAGLMGGIVMLWNALWSALMGSVTPPEDAPPAATPEATPFPDMIDPGVQHPGAAESAFNSFSPPELPWGWIAAGAAAVLLTVIAVRLASAGRRTSEPRKCEDAVSERDEEADRPLRRKKPRRRAKQPTPRERVRGTYREYLSFLSVNGVRPGPGCTTEDISRSSSEILVGETDELLRGLYRKARYSEKPVSAEEADAAQAALSRLTQDGNIKKSGSH